MEPKKPSDKQTASRKRNWFVRCLRAYWNLIPYGCSSETVEAIRKLIDAELAKVGAEPESKRREQRQRGWEEKYGDMEIEQ